MESNKKEKLISDPPPTVCKENNASTRKAPFDLRIQNYFTDLARRWPFTVVTGLTIGSLLALPGMLAVFFGTVDFFDARYYPESARLPLFFALFICALFLLLTIIGIIGVGIIFCDIISSQKRRRGSIFLKCVKFAYLLMCIIICGICFLCCDIFFTAQLLGYINEY